METIRLESFRISSNFEDMDLAVIHEFISKSYWAKGIPVATLERAIENSLCFAVLKADGSQVGFARVVTDYATFAYLADVFVIKKFRGKGLSKMLIREVIEHHQLQGLRRFVLATKDAHGLYEQYGFKALTSPHTFMEVLVRDVYTKE